MIFMDMKYSGSVLSFFFLLGIEFLLVFGVLDFALIGTAHQIEDQK